MTDPREKKEAFEDARLVLYAAVLLGSVLCCVMPFHYLCDLEGISCWFCGMRHAVDYVLALDFASAYRSNPLIVGVILFFVWMVTDCVVIVQRRIKENNKTAE